MGWPENTETLKKFYPTTDLVTGPDIIFFWVARMIMAGYEYMGEMPFRNVYFTGIIREKQGRKMSKSLGNSPDPLELIGSYGADALRLGVMRSAPLGQDVLFDEKNVELGRNFCTKLWVPRDSGKCRAASGRTKSIRATHDRRQMVFYSGSMPRFAKSRARRIPFHRCHAGALSVLLGECDWYLEASRPRSHELKVNTLAVIDFVLGHTLRLFHPFLPFITKNCGGTSPSRHGAAAASRRERS
jgi:valyl-tRNA synthetase